MREISTSLLLHQLQIFVWSETNFQSDYGIMFHNFVLLASSGWFSLTKVFVATEDDRRLLKEVLHNKNCSALFNFEFFFVKPKRHLQSGCNISSYATSSWSFSPSTSESAPTCQLRSLLKLKVRTYVSYWERIRFP